jgi:ferredoxin
VSNLANKVKPNGIRVALATCHDKRNFGSMLQAYATQAYLEAQGYDVRTIDKTGLGNAIKPGRMDYYRRNALDMQMYREKAPFVGKIALQKVDKKFGHEMDERRRAFDKFAETHFHLTRKTYTFDELRELSLEYDAVVVGSDQLWLPVNIGGGYFTLEWVDPSVRKVSYATSIGLSHLDEFYLGRMRDFLSSYDAISVREDSAAALVEEATGTRPVVACDPTMLLTAEEWRGVADESFDGLPKEPYLLCYFMGDNPWQRQCAVRYARAHGLKLVAIAQNDIYIASDGDYADIYPWSAGPAQWLALFEHASFVCTDSFHGSVFSNIFQVPFVSFRRHAAKSGQSTNSRIDTLLRVLGLPERICESEEAFDSVAASEIDFSESEKKLDLYRAESASWLDKTLAFEGKTSSPHVDISHAEDCCGCAACANVCPTQCITMAFDRKGCEYPKIDESKCIGCGKCVRACPIINVTSDEPREDFVQRAFVVQNKDAAVLRQSTSGGAFTALATTVIQMGGVVFGSGYDRDGKAAYDRSLAVRCFAVDKVEDLRFFRNSKYVQSEIGNAYQEVDEYLKQGRLVLFSGTPCQCEGLYHYFGGKIPRGLGMVDVVCHAVPCRAVFSAYLDWLEDSTGSEVQSVLFRDKGRWGYEYSNMRAFDKEEPFQPKTSGNQIQPVYSEGVETDPYLRAFFGDLSDRQSCYQCRFKKRYRITDMTLWDCFDAWRYGNGFDDNRGATRILVHSDKGQTLLEASLGMLRVKELDADEAASRSRELTHSVDPSPSRTAMFADLGIMDGSKFVKKWFPMDAKVAVKRGARELLERTGAYSAAKKTLQQLRGR